MKPMISSGVVARVSRTATRRPCRSTVIRSVIANTSWMLCEIRTTDLPCVRKRSMKPSTLRTSATANAAVGSSMMMRSASMLSARAIATPCRWPPESASTQISRIGDVDVEVAEQLVGPAPHRGAVKEGDARRSAGRAPGRGRCCRRSTFFPRAQAPDRWSRRPVGPGVLRPGKFHGLAVEPHLAGVGAVRARHYLDQRGFAGAIVTDQRHHFAAAEARSRRVRAPTRRQSAW